MNILVTGGAGFIGSNFVKHILERKGNKDKIIILDALTYAGNLDNLSEFLNEENLIVPEEQVSLAALRWGIHSELVDIPSFEKASARLLFKLSSRNYSSPKTQEVGQAVERALEFTGVAFVVANIADQQIAAQLLQQADIVVNFAAETHVDRSILNPDQFIKTDVYGTYVLLEAARESERLTKFVHVSTDEIYGAAHEKSFTESDPINPRNPYSASKAAADRLVYAYNQTYGLPINIVRPSNNFGPYQYPEKLIPVMILKALREEQLPVYGDGKQIRDWLYVRDTAKAIELVVEKGTIGEVYNVAGGNEKENIWIVHSILNHLNKPSSLIKYVKDRPGHDVRYSLDDSKIRKELGYSEMATLEERLQKTVEWYVKNQNWWEKILKNDQEYKEFMEKWYKER
jgi:dTDP-glucose 4,6-dehydratase